MDKITKNANLTCSIAMATYNGSSYIEKQLLSLIRQTHPADEVIICDDCSSDNTVDIINRLIKTYRLTNWKVYQNKKNLGFIENFRQCLQKCTSDIIFLCDQDDIWYEDKIDIMLDIFQKNPNIQSLTAGFKLIDSDDNILYPEIKNDNIWFNSFSGHGHLKYNKIYKIKLERILLSNVAPGCTQAFRNELVPSFLKHKVDIPHDYTLNILAGLTDGLYYLNSPVIYYRTHGTNSIGFPSSDICIKWRYEKNYWNIFKYYIRLLKFSMSIIKNKNFNNCIYESFPFDFNKMWNDIPLKTLAFVKHFDNNLKVQKTTQECENFFNIRHALIHSNTSHKWKIYLKKRFKYRNFSKFDTLYGDPMFKIRQSVFDFLLIFKK